LGDDVFFPYLVEQRRHLVHCSNTW
jgi:hypothetical protein